MRLNTPEGVEEAIGLLQNTVYSFSMKVCGHPEDAEDTMQEVLFRSIGHLAKIDSPQQLAVWLYTVTRNRCWRMRRKPAHAPARMLSLDELMPSYEEIGLLLQDGGIGPESSLLCSEKHQLLHQATLRIPASLRIVLVLHDMEELTTEQVAQILDLRQGTVRIRLHRARLTVRKEMKQLLNGTAGNSDRVESSTETASVRRSRSKRRPDECRDLFANLSEYIDGKLEPVPCEQMKTHIEACPSCVAFLRDLRTAIDRCRSLDMPCNSDISPRLRSMLTREYLRMLVMPAAK
ncbi:MAG: sigma-70 family RNA polymerase sigma factor [Terracidiphilus sp.]